ncbi:uncharacterized protein LOC131528654 [Onychostoma macrolepis]|uniref:uncharacterized protein LOC131528654 n=1 Tax=Onychostoma macrolepis TaxID=369639 RepID=UPI00272D7A37|nr:uncharacterized protein LOC131528654 [Onychostoma macrolepis]XP_058613946.1 uncharacterized protein LOC131528654 [Onychostoma macrolepis]
MLTNSHPPSLYCLLLSFLCQLHHCCILSVPLLTLSPPSVRWDRRGSASLHRCRGWRIPRLTPPRPVDTAAPSWLLALSSPPWLLSPPSSLGSLVPWSVIDPSAASGLHSSGCTLSLRPFSSVRLLLPFGSTLVLCHSGSTAAFRIPASTLVAGAYCSALDLLILPFALALRLSISTSGSPTTCSATVSQPPGVVSHSSTMAPPSVGSTVGRHPGWGLGPSWLLLLQVPPVSTMAHSSIVSSLVFSVS